MKKHDYLCDGHNNEPRNLKEEEMGRKMQYVRFDWAAKRLLRQKANFAVLEGFLTVFIGEKITIVEILESESNQEFDNDKFNRVDIKARNSKGEIIIIEVQNNFEANFMERVLYGVAKTITEHINLGDDYSHVVKVYSISILYFDLGKGSDYLYHGQNRFIGVHTNDELQIKVREKNALVARTPTSIFPEYIIIRVNEFDSVAVTPLEEWMRYLKEGEIGDDTSAPGLKEAKERLDFYSMPDNERQAYVRHIDNLVIQKDVFSSAKTQGYLEGKTEGIAEGRAEGRAEGKADTAHNLKLLGVDVETIAKATGLTEEEISAL